MQSFLLTGRPPVKAGHQLPNGVWSGRMFRMKRTIRILAGLVACRAVSVLGQVPSPESPWEMAVATERWLVEGAGARFLPGMDDPARDGNTFVFVDKSWPAAFQARVGDAVYLRISPTTGCYDFEDANGNVFWTIVPYAPLTWNWISPFRSPFHPDEQNLYSPFRLVREWRLTTPEIEEMRMVPMRCTPLRSTPPEPVTNLSISVNGLVGWSAGRPPFTSSESGNGSSRRIPFSGDPSATVAAFWDNLYAQSSLSSFVALSTYGPSGSQVAVVEFSHMGFYAGATNGIVSFQVQFSETETNQVHVVFSEASGLGTGGSATLGARSSRDVRFFDSQDCPERNPCTGYPRIDTDNRNRKGGNGFIRMATQHARLKTRSRDVAAT